MVVRGRTRVTRKGQITIPAEIRAALHLREGDRLNVSLDADGAIRIDKAGSWVERTAGALRRPGMPSLSNEELNAATHQAAQEAAIARDERSKRG